MDWMFNPNEQPILVLKSAPNSSYSTSMQIPPNPSSSSPLYTSPSCFFFISIQQQSSTNMESRKSTQAPLLVFFSFALLLATVQSVTPPGTIERTTKQQILVSIPPSSEASGPTGGASELFLSSPSGKFEGYLLRRETAPGAGGFGNDFCYIQIQEGGKSVWESECAPVTTANTCSLVFSDAGLEIFDGSRSSWDTDADGEQLETLVMVDTGDMQIRDKDGELAWKASDNPLSNQECGSVGSPGLNAAHAPFAHPIGDRTVFGQPEDNQQQGSGSGVSQQQPLGFQQPLNSQPFSGLTQQPFGANNQQPLVDNSPFDSASSRHLASQHGVGSAVLIAALVAYGVL
ncbi:uncharacterized protein [Aristolochia californica]|uniref:uncharacterized protein n=1 Tax=Aristolochia californica TaxID=171875 RepID=UPI0035DB25C3